MIIKSKSSVIFKKNTQTRIGEKELIVNLVDDHVYMFKGEKHVRN